MTVQDAIASFHQDEYDDFLSGPPEYRQKLLRQYGVPEEQITAYLLSQDQAGDEPGNNQVSHGGEDTQQKALKWTKAQTLLTASGVLIAAAALAVAIVSCQRG